MKYPVPLQLAGEELPRVETAEHLNMEKDCHRARGRFISNSIDVREKLSFAHPHLKMKAVQIMCMYAYGSMLWELGSQSAEQFFKCCNTCEILSFDVPRNTFTFLVEGFLGSDMRSMRNQIFSRYSGFIENC